MGSQNVHKHELLVVLRGHFSMNVLILDNTNQYKYHNDLDNWVLTTDKW